MNDNLNYVFARAWGEPVARGLIRQCPADFLVTETLSFSPSGQGDHIYLFLEKTSCNTDWVAAQLVKLSGLKAVDVGYAGLKDRHAITRQWFSLHMPNQPEPNWSKLPSAIRILSKTRHEKKLKIGAIKQNGFELCIRDLQCEPYQLDARLTVIQKQGVPNYFGPQRFGRNNANVQRLISQTNEGKRLKREQRGILISAARSYLFNHILSKRVIGGNWNRIISGDILMLNGSRSIFKPETNDLELAQRILDLDIHPCAILWGRGKPLISDVAANVEQNIIDEYPQITQSLDKWSTTLAHRAMRTVVNNLEWELSNVITSQAAEEGENSQILPPSSQFIKNGPTVQLKLRFSLVAGSYATSVLSEFLA